MEQPTYDRSTEQMVTKQLIWHQGDCNSSWHRIRGGAHMYGSRIKAGIDYRELTVL